MAEHITWNGNLLWSADGSTPNFRCRALVDLNKRVHQWEEIGDALLSSILRGTKSERRPVKLVFGLIAGGGYTITDLKAAWEAWHSQALGEDVLEVETENGNTLYLDAVAETPEWGNEGPNWAEVTQEYTAANPFWRGAVASAAANFNGGTPVNLVCDNDGDLDAWISFVAEGAVEDPKLELAGEWEIEFALDVAVGEELQVDCKTPATAWYVMPTESERAYGYRTFASSFRKAKLAPGNNTVVLTATAGAGLCTISWYPLYEALQ